MSAEPLTLREGDVFRWLYREPGDDRAYGRYHCCSRIGIVRNGRLRDTYWMIGDSFHSDGRSFGPDRLSDLVLTRLGNLDDLVKAPEYHEEYYADSDIVNLNHANSTRGNFYIRKGAVRSTAKMLEATRRKLEKALSDERRAAERATELRSLIADIEAGDTSVYIGA